MSGLLDKANKAAEDKEEAEVVDAVVEVSEVRVAELNLISDNGLNMEHSKFQIGAVVGFISNYDSCFLHRHNRSIWRLYIGRLICSRCYPLVVGLQR